MYHENKGLREFGRCRFDVDNKFLWHGESPIDLPPKALELLCLLIENQGAVVSKSEIWRVVWDDSFVEETNLTHLIYLLRKKFKELGECDPIQTVPRRGYRFVGKPAPGFVIERHAVTQTLIEEVSTAESGAGTRTSFTFNRRFRMKAVAIAAALVVVLGSGYWAISTEQKAGAEPRIRSLAVLPFISLNGSSKDDGIGMADVLITRLSSVRSVKVRPTGSVIALGGLDSIAAGRKLGVDAVLEGTLDTSGATVTATTRLISLSDGAVIWADKYERPLGREASLQHEIASRVAGLLSHELTSIERGGLTKSHTFDPDAWQEYSMGRVEWSKRNWAGATEAERRFRNAIAIDPNFALAYAGLADALAVGGERSMVEAIIDKALELDPQLAAAHATRGFVRMFRDWDWNSAEASLLRAIELNPNYAPAHHWRAELLAIRGRNPEAKAAMRKALELDPRSAHYLADMGQIYYFAREYGEAEDYCKKALAIDPEFVFAHEYLHDIYLMTGEHEKAVEAELEAQRVNGALPTNSDDRRRKLDEQLRNQRDLFRAGGIGSFERNNATSSSDIRLDYVAATRLMYLGEQDKAIMALGRSVDERQFLTVFAKADPIFDPIRDDERFRALIAKMAL